MKRGLYETKHTRSWASHTPEDAADTMSGNYKDLLDPSFWEIRTILDPDEFHKCLLFVRKLYEIDGMCYKKVKELLGYYVVMITGKHLSNDDLEEAYAWCERLLEMDDEDEEPETAGCELAVHAEPVELTEEDLEKRVEDFNLTLLEAGSSVSIVRDELDPEFNAYEAVINDGGIESFELSPMFYTMLQNHFNPRYVGSDTKSKFYLF